MLQRYHRPPLVEATYEVFVRDAPGWSQLSEQQLEQNLKASFSGQRETLEPVGVDILLGPRGVSHSPVQGAKRVRLWSEDKGSLVQFSQEMAALNVLLAGYSSYASVVPQLENVVRAYLSASQPTRLAWIGQRYLNKIELPTAASEASTYFHYYPRVPAVGIHRPFALQVVSEVFDGGEVVLNLTFKGKHGERPIYFLGIYARSNVEIEPRLETIMRWQTTAHEAIRRSFTAALTDSCRQLFDEEVQP
ncbi:MAG: TIGR04255 family protein [Hyalangium sp.]|uniref:TIGR04255 family protein n=1 Tax=Hyalangium sp. TaxID=2028555 RepID=UPI00389AF4FB